MSKSFKQVREISSQMVNSQKKLKAAQKEYEDLARLDWSLPTPLNELDWVLPIVSTGPYDALRGVTRALSNLKEGLTVHPITAHKVLDGEEGMESRDIANEWEVALQWQIQRASKRNPAYRSSIVWSAALYHEIVARLIHLPTEFKARSIGDVREKAALRFGDWAVRLVDPKTVYVDYSTYMPERALFANLKTARQIVDFWGDKAGRINAKINKKRRPCHGELR